MSKMWERGPAQTGGFWAPGALLHFLEYAAHWAAPGPPLLEGVKARHFVPAVVTPLLPPILERGPVRPFLILCYLCLRSPALVLQSWPLVLRRRRSRSEDFMATALPVTEMLFPRGGGLLTKRF